METYRRLETPKIWGLVKTQNIDSNGNLSDGSLVDPATSQQIIIEDSSGQIVQALDDMTKSVTGKYYYDGYTIASDALLGTYHYEIRVKDGTKTSVIRGAFKVEEQIA